MSAARADRTGRGFRVAVLGGGYAALSAALAIRARAPASRLTLIAPRKAHIKTTRLHESLRHSLRRCCVLYSDLARRFGFRFLQAKLRFSEESLVRWQQRHYLQIGEAGVPFDFLIVATGARCAPKDTASGAFTLEDFFLNRAQTALRGLCERPDFDCTVVGGGATGLQFLFEISAFLRHKARGRFRLRLMTLESRLLTQFPPAFHEHALARLAAEGIDWLPACEFVAQQGLRLQARSVEEHEPLSQPSDLTLLFSGIRPDPVAIATNPFGQALADDRVLEHIFAAGDCARFPLPGADTLSAQVAVRKGQLVAANVVSAAAGGALTLYRYREQGYIVGLGPEDAIGWVGSRDHLVRGLAAVTLKSAIERQYDLLLAGIDTYRL